MQEKDVALEITLDATLRSLTRAFVKLFSSHSPAPHVALALVHVKDTPTARVCLSILSKNKYPRILYICIALLLDPYYTDLHADLFSCIGNNWSGDVGVFEGLSGFDVQAFVSESTGKEEKEVSAVFRRYWSGGAKDAGVLLGKGKRRFVVEGFEGLFTEI